MSNLPQHVIIFRDGADGVGIPVAGEKPDENKLYPPKPHTHVLADIPGLDDYIAGLLDGGELTVVGKSAYQSWLEQPGNTGKTEADFVTSLKGKDGDAGKSAYEIWLTQSGNAGKSEADFLASLKGEKGADGAASNLDAYAKRSWVEEKIAEAELGAELGEPVDLSNFATKSYVEEKFGELDLGGATFYGTVKTAVGNICSVEPLGSEGVTITGCTIHSVAPGVGDFVAINRQYNRWYGFVYRRATGETGLPPDVDPTSAIVTDITCGWECSGLVLDDGKLFLAGRGLADSTGHLPEVEHGVACASVVSGGPTIGFITRQGLLYTRANITDPIASAAIWKGALGRQVQNDYDGESYMKYGLVPLAQGVRKYACNQDGDGMLGAVGGIVVGRAGMAVVLADGTVMTCANFVQSTSGGVKFERHLGRVTGTGYDYDVLQPVPNIAAKDAALLIYPRDGIYRGDLYIVAENGDVYASAPFSGSATAYEAMTIQTEFKAKSVAAGSRHVVFIDEDDDVWTYGYDNGFGQLGHSGPAGLQKIPAIKAKQAACGEYHMALIDLDDNLWTCGQNSHGQLCVAPARNSQIERNGVCFKVPDFQAATVACGSAHTLAIDLDGHAYSGGINNACQLGRDVASGDETTSNFGRIYLPS